MRILHSFCSSTGRRLACRILLTLIVLTVASAEALASHFRYATISAQPVLNAAGQPTGIMRFTIKSAWRRSFFGSPVIGSTINPESFIFGDGTSQNLIMTVTSFNAGEDWVVAETTITHQYPAGNASSSWIARGDSGARIANLNNGSNGNWYYETLVRPYTTNSSPTTALPPIVTVPKSTAAQFFVPASDVDRDTLSFRMSTFAGSGTTPTPPGFSINSSTGLVTWNNNALNTTNFWFAQIIIEDKDSAGVVKSRIPVDVLLKIVAVTSQPPRCLIDGLTTPKTISVQAGSPVSFVITGDDPDGAVPITLNASGMPGAATLSPAMPFSGTAPIGSTFNWTPTAADGGSRTISFSTTDNTGLVTLNSVNIFVENNQPPTITGPATLTTPVTPQAPISVQVADPNGDALTVTWELDGAVVRTDSVPASPSATTLTFTGYGGVGPHTVKATVKDTKNATASLTTAVTVIKADQTITFGALADATFNDADFPVSATASSGLTVSFAATGSCTVTGASVHITGAGSCTVQASQAGDDNYNPAPNVDQSFTIAKANQTITFGALAGKTFNDADFTVSATASSGLSVSFSATGSCTVTGVSVHITGAGSCTVQASQAGNDNYNAAPNVDQAFTIAKANQTITFGALAGKTFNDADFPVSATASSGLSVSFSATGSCTVTGVSVHLTGAGSCTVQASQAGNDNYNPAPNVDQAFTIAKANQVITVVTAAPATAIYNTSFTVSATGGGSGNAVSIAASGACGVTAGGAGSATVQMNSGTGTCTLGYNQAGDANYNAAAQVLSSTTAQKAAQSLTITTGAPATAVFGSSFTVAATGGGSGNPVLYTTGVDGCTDVGPTFTVTSGVTACVVLYNQAGNANYTPAPQLTQTVNVVGFGFEGFFAPIDVPAPNFMIWNSAKAGQTIPAKWRLTLAGVPVSSLSSFAGLYSYQVSCTSGTGDVEYAIEEYATGGSVLTYDGDGQFHYNWATPLSYRNTCRAMYVKFSDGSVSKVASFRFK
jgi:hypothetical protein